jgi:hypothetical protein
VKKLAPGNCKLTVVNLPKAVLKHRTPHAAATLVADSNFAKRLECGGSPPLSKPGFWNFAF